MTTPDVNVVLINFPNSRKEMVVPNEDGTYTILINAKLSHDSQLKAYAHAMKHIINNDFEKDNTQSIEAVAHGISQQPDIKAIPAKDYLEEIRKIQRRRKRLQKEIKKDEERVRFLIEHCNTFSISENRYLYGKDL